MEICRAADNRILDRIMYSARWLGTASRRITNEAPAALCKATADHTEIYEALVARDLATTRSAAAVELWRDRLAGAVVVIGNAPTALFHLLDLGGLLLAGAGAGTVLTARRRSTEQSARRGSARGRTAPAHPATARRPRARARRPSRRLRARSPRTAAARTRSRRAHREHRSPRRRPTRRSAPPRRAGAAAAAGLAKRIRPSGSTMTMASGAASTAAPAL